MYPIWAWIKVIDVQQVRPPILLAIDVNIRGRPQRPSSDILEQCIVEEQNDCVGDSESRKKKTCSQVHAYAQKQQLLHRAGNYHTSIAICTVCFFCYVSVNNVYSQQHFNIKHQTSNSDECKTWASWTSVHRLFSSSRSDSKTSATARFKTHKRWRKVHISSLTIIKCTRTFTHSGASWSIINHTKVYRFYYEL